MVALQQSFRLGIEPQRRALIIQRLHPAKKGAIVLDGILMSRKPRREGRFQLLHVRVGHRTGVDAERPASSLEKTARLLHRDDRIR